MPYVPGGSPQAVYGGIGVEDVYHSPNVFANHVEIALWNPPGPTEREALTALAAISATKIDTLPAISTAEQQVASVLSSPEVTFQQEQLDGDGVTDATTSSVIAVQIATNNATGIASGQLTTASQIATTVGTIDSTPPSTTATTKIVVTNWDQFNQDNIPYDTLMLTPKTSLATFTTKATLWGNQPKPFGPNAVQPGLGDNKHIKAQNYYIGGVVKGAVSVPQILHNLSNLASNVWEPFKAKYPSAVVTNTFRQNKPGGGNNQAQHGLGMAMDIQLLGATPQIYYEAACWIRDNLQFDQLLQEKSGASRWIHVSYYSGYGYQVPTINKVANCIVSPQYSFVPGLSVMT